MEPVRVWSMFQATTTDVTDDINEFTECVVDLICETTEATMPKTKVKSVHNQKPWITTTFKDAINTHATSGITKQQPTM